jgi:hypothetical protein
MGKINKPTALLLTLIIAMSCLTLLTVKPANAQTIPIPAVPQFTVRSVNVSNTQNYLIEISIKSQPFAYSNDGSLYQEYFNIRVKQQSAQNWTEAYPIYNGTSSHSGGVTPLPLGNFSYAEYISPDSPLQSNPSTTADFYVIPEENNGVFDGYSIQSTYGIWGANPIDNQTLLDEIPMDGQVDFQVQAIIGHNSTVWYNISALWAGIGVYVPAVAYDTASGWSTTQTLTIPPSSTSPTPTATSSVPELSRLAILPLFLSAFFLVVILRYRKTAN